MIDNALAGWVVNNFGQKLSHEEQKLLHSLTRAACHAAHLKHTCVSLERVPALQEPLLNELLSVVTPKKLSALWKKLDCDSIPLQISSDGKSFWLQKYRHYESSVASRLLEMADSNELSGISITDNSDGLTDEQQIAANSALSRKFTVISGGPGTGKTYTVGKIIQRLRQHNGQCRIALAAPTGKAAQRMTESVRSAVGENSQVRLEARTIDSLLGMHIHALTPRKNRQNPLDVDMLVVDEASMLSLPMVYRLLQALPEKARLVLLGDRDQLASVEAGSVLADICLGLDSKGAVNRITESRRFRDVPEIGAMANWLNDPAVTKPGFAGSSVKVHTTTAGNPWQPEWLDAVQQFHSAVESDIRSGKPCAQILAKQQQFQLLCAFREGPFGVSGINHILEKALGHPANGWYAGKPVIVLQNDHSRRLYNGDVGIVLPQEDGSLKACFPDGAGFRAISRMQMPPHETCYAITVHKSQGSEYNHVVVVLPASAKEAAGNPVLTRELAYTAVTRAKQKVDIYCGEGVLEGMAGRTTVRMSSMFMAQPL